EEQLEAFYRQPPGTIAITPGWRLGVDFNQSTGVRWFVVAKVPFEDLSDPFNKARLDADGWNAYRYRAVLEMVQACGRTRWGDDRPRGAIADGSWNSALNKKSPIWYQECIKKG
ncbi:hypothetical protein KKE60_06865, partial [Patescibacteria group bacterium]|nr:hypothetical protein [Patescibacteria group bacterium]